MSQHRTAARLLAGAAVVTSVVLGVGAPAQAFDTGWNGTVKKHSDTGWDGTVKTTFDTGWNGTIATRG